MESGEYTALVPRVPYSGSISGGIYGEIRGGVGLATGQVFYSHEENPPVKLLTIRGDGQSPQLLTELSSASSFALSPDGQQIAFLGGIDLESNTPASGLVVMNADGSDMQLLSTNLNGRYRASLTWSPDSRTIAFRTYIQTPATVVEGVPEDFRNMTIHLLDVATGFERPLLTDGSTGNIDPVWSPDGSQIAFASFRSGHSEIWLVNADSTNLRQLTHHGQLARFPVWLEQSESSQ